MVDAVLNMKPIPNALRVFPAGDSEVKRSHRSQGYCQLPERRLLMGCFISLRREHVLMETRGAEKNCNEIGRRKIDWPFRRLQQKQSGNLRGVTTLDEAEFLSEGGAATERLDCSPPTKVETGLDPRPGRFPGFLKRGSCRAMPLVGGFSRQSTVFPRPCISALLHTHLSQDIVHQTPLTYLFTELCRGSNQMVARNEINCEGAKNRKHARRENAASSFPAIGYSRYAGIAKAKVDVIKTDDLWQPFPRSDGNTMREARMTTRTKAGPLSSGCNLPDLVKLCLHGAEGYPGSRTLAGLQNSAKHTPRTAPSPRMTYFRAVDHVGNNKNGRFENVHWLLNVVLIKRTTFCRMLSYDTKRMHKRGLNEHRRTTAEVEGRGGVVARLLTPTPRRIEFDSRQGHSRISACGNRGGRFRCLTGFPLGSPVSPRPFIPTLLHTHLASPSSSLKTSMLNSRPNLFTHSVNEGDKCPKTHLKCANTFTSNLHVCYRAVYVNLGQNYLHRHARMPACRNYFLLRITNTPGVTVAERLACSPPTKAIRVQSPAGSLQMWESCRFSRGYPISPTLSFRRRFILASITLIGSQDHAICLFDCLGFRVASRAHAYLQTSFADSPLHGRFDTRGANFVCGVGSISGKPFKTVVLVRQASGTLGFSRQRCTNMATITNERLRVDESSINCGLCVRCAGLRVMASGVLTNLIEVLSQVAVDGQWLYFCITFLDTFEFATHVRASINSLTAAVRDIQSNHAQSSQNWSDSTSMQQRMENRRWLEYIYSTVKFSLVPNNNVNFAGLCHNSVAQGKAMFTLVLYLGLAQQVATIVSPTQQLVRRERYPLRVGWTRASDVKKRGSDTGDTNTHA
ncbi:hypothetical protein PR048_030745 [Dryococelus australis]|uniref:Uncharacterized protein n=1 Tax=Dryococelus australis TaxID=614101 RepID=A0ABQ9G9S7_9NEOP|nr:hypothetical protein PR048_030745 [Dryococelus australis]